MDFYEAWWFISQHPMNNGWQGMSMGMYNLDIHVAKVDPITRTIEDDDSRNTHVEIWLEFGSYFDKVAADPKLFEGIEISEWDRWERNHDPRLDCGADTFEEAIIKLAGLVKEHYGEY